MDSESICSGQCVCTGNPPRPVILSKVGGSLVSNPDLPSTLQEKNALFQSKSRTQTLLLSSLEEGLCTRLGRLGLKQHILLYFTHAFFVLNNEW